MNRLTGAIGACLVVMVSFGVDTASSTSAQARTYVLDRAVSCRIAGVGYPDPARFVGMSAYPSQGTGPTASSPRAVAWHGSGPGGFNVGFMVGRGGHASLNRTQCVASKARVSLSTRGLVGGRTQFGEAHTCEVSSRVLVRLRVVFRRPFALRADRRWPYQLVARGTTVEGLLMVTTPKGQPIASAMATATGPAQIFVSPARCFPS